MLSTLCVYVYMYIYALSANKPSMIKNINFYGDSIIYSQMIYKYNYISEQYIYNML